MMPSPTRRTHACGAILVLVGGVGSGATGSTLSRSTCHSGTVWGTCTGTCHGQNHNNRRW